MGPLGRGLVSACIAQHIYIQVTCFRNRRRSLKSSFSTFRHTFWWPRGRSQDEALYWEAGSVLGCGGPRAGSIFDSLLTPCLPFPIPPGRKIMVSNMRAKSWDFRGKTCEITRLGWLCHKNANPWKMEDIYGTGLSGNPKMSLPFATRFLKEPYKTMRKQQGQFSKSSALLSLSLPSV